MGIKNFNMIVYKHKKYILLPFALSVLIVCQSLAQNYQGTFSGVQPGVSLSAELTVQDRQLLGRLIMNGKGADVNGIIKDSLSSGTVYDIELNKSYAYSSVIRQNELHFFITFPELNNQAIGKSRNFIFTRFNIESAGNLVNLANNLFNSNKPDSV